MRLYKLVLGRIHTTHRLFDFIQSTIGVKKGCPLLLTLYGIYIDELELGILPSRAHPGW